MSILTDIRAEIESQGVDWNSVCLFAPQQIISLLLGGNPEPFKQFVEDTFSITLSNYSISASNDQTKLENLSVPTTVDLYSYYSIWAEESAGLGANATEWSFGNGDETPSGHGVHIGINSELIAVGLNVENGSGNVRIIQNGADTSIESGTVLSPGGLNQLATPLNFSAGDILNFRTVSASGTTSGRAIAWFRVPIGSIPSIKGDKGDVGNNGVDGANGVPSQYARISLNSSTNVNTASEFANFNTVTSGNIPSLVVNTNSITLPTGSYEINLTGNLSSTVQRSNVGVNFYINSSLYSTKNVQNYIRSQSGHNEAAVTFNDMFTLPSTQNIELEFFTQALSGNVALENTSWITIKKIA